MVDLMGRDRLERERERKRGALPEAAFQPDLPAVELDERL
jgi:hypothetical protein